MLYPYNPHSHVKIWLSGNPNIFMNFENQVRLIEMREKNPNDVIHLVYDSSLLNDYSLIILDEYCKENHIISIDANTFKKHLKSDNEKILYKFYKDEINHLDEGGNLAVASDILRWLPPVYSIGSYSDLDFPIDTTCLPETIMVAAPLLLNIGSLTVGSKQFIFSNNDYIAIVDPSAAQEQIGRVQTALINKLGKYDTDFIEKSKKALNEGCLLNSYFTSYMENCSESIYLKKIKLVTHKTGEIPSRTLRAYIQNVMTDKNKFLDFYKMSDDEPHTSVVERLKNDQGKQLGSIKWLFFRKEYDEIKKAALQSDDEFISYLMKKERSLYLKSIVVCTTGPIEIANALFNGSVLSTKDFDKHVAPFSFNDYDLQKAFQSKNSLPMHINIINMLQFLGTDQGKINDSSWLEGGKILQASRQEKLIDRQKQLASRLPGAFLEKKIDLQNHIKKIENDMAGSCAFFSESINTEKITVLKKILKCYRQNGEMRWFDIGQFKDILMNDIHPHKKNIFAEFFFNRSQKLVDDLEQLCHDALLYRLAANRKINLISGLDHENEPGYQSRIGNTQ